MQVIAKILQPLLKPGVCHLLSGKKELVFLSSDSICNLKKFSDLKHVIPSETKMQILKEKQIFSFHNGMGHDVNDFVKLVTRINQVAKANQLVINIFNESEGTLSDVTYVAKQKFYLSTDKTCTLANKMLEALEFVESEFPNVTLTHFAHSEAAIICDNMLRCLTDKGIEKTKSYLDVITLGSPRPICSTRVRSAINMYSEEDYLVIPFVKMYDTIGDYHFQSISPISEKKQKHLQFIDHSMMGDTYFQIIEQTLKKTPSSL